MEEKILIQQQVKPFLRWAGGKRWLLKSLSQFLPREGFNNYHEPFLGGGAVFFYLKPQKTSFISDVNSDLIKTYIAIQQDVEDVIKELKLLKNSEEDYYNIRKEKIKSSNKKAAQFIYLNQMSFNGIYRVNLNGEYNVPYGHREKYQFDYDNIRKVSRVLKKTIIKACDFKESIKNVKKGDLVFIDPPYTVTHNDNGFFHYNKKLFSKEDQCELAEMVSSIKKKGAFYILTNAAHNEIKKIFSNGDHIIEMERASLIGGKNAKRGKYKELIITNTIR